VTGEIVEVFFLRKDVGLRRFLAASETPEEYRGIDLRGDFGAAIGVDAVGFALASLLCDRLGGERGEAEKDYNKGEEWREFCVPGQCLAEMPKSAGAP
jgi:hypothetical protein